MSEYQIGQRVWVFEVNRRIYSKAPEGQLWSGGSLIYSEHFVERAVVGETSRSWIIGDGKRPQSTWIQFKVPKGKNGCNQHGTRVIYSDEQKDADIWLHDHRYEIVRMVERADPRTIVEVGKLVGYKPAIERATLP